jgi:hypothetical protein
LRRQVASVSGSLELTDGRREAITRETMIAGTRRRSALAAAIGARRRAGRPRAA